jgi:hypothetical protein
MSNSGSTEHDTSCSSAVLPPAMPPPGLLLERMTSSDYVHAMLLLDDQMHKLHNDTTDNGSCSVRPPASSGCNDDPTTIRRPNSIIGRHHSLSSPYLELPHATCHQAADPTIFDWTTPPPPQSLIGNHAPPTTVEVDTLLNRKREEDSVDRLAEVPPYHWLHIHPHHEMKLARLSSSASSWQSLGGTELHDLTTEELIDIALNDQSLPSTTTLTTSRGPTMVAMYHPPRRGASQLSWKRNSGRQKFQCTTTTTTTSNSNSCTAAME